MNPRRLLLLAMTSVILCVAVGYGQNNRTVVPVGSNLYSYVDHLYREAGLAPPNAARPWTAHEVLQVVERLDAATLSDAAQDLLRYVVDTVQAITPAFSEDNFAFDSSPALYFEGFYHHTISDTSSTPAEAYEWIHGYEERKPFITIPLEFWYGDALYMTSDITGKEEHRTVTSPTTPDVAQNYTNILFDDPNIRLDLYFPYRAVLSTGGNWWNLLFGRDTLSWGNGRSGNLMLSDYSDFYDFVLLSFMSPSFKFTNVFATMDRFLPDGTDIGYAGMVAHRLEMRFFNRVTLTINEAVTLANMTSEYIRDLNYLMVFHNWMAPERLNSLMTIELSVNPWKYINVYGHLAMDEFAVKYEEDRGGGGGPPVYGYLAGIQGSYLLGPGILDGALEWVQTSPWLYNRRAAPYYYNVRRYWSLITDSFEYIAKPIGYEYGSDSIVYHASAAYRVPGVFAAEAEIEYVTRGEKGIGALWDPAPGDAPPTGIPEKRLIVHLGGSWEALPYLEIGGALNWSYTTNPGHLEGESRSDAEVTMYVRLGGM